MASILIAERYLFEFSVCERAAQDRVERVLQLIVERFELGFDDFGWNCARDVRQSACVEAVRYQQRGALRVLNRRGLSEQLADFSDLFSDGLLHRLGGANEATEHADIEVRMQIDLVVSEQLEQVGSGHGTCLGGSERPWLRGPLATRGRTAPPRASGLRCTGRRRTTD